VVSFQPPFLWISDLETEGRRLIRKVPANLNDLADIGILVLDSVDHPGFLGGRVRRACRPGELEKPPNHKGSRDADLT
jgi:hypothetical protein